MKAVTLKLCPKHKQLTLVNTSYGSDMFKPKIKEVYKCPQQNCKFRYESIQD